MNLKLIVVRTPDIKILSDFYADLGLSFDYHKHGDSPYHYSSTIGETVLEIYPLTKTQTEPDKNLRLGFSIDNFDLLMMKLEGQGVNILCEPIQTEFGYLAVVEDPDGRKIELYKK